MEGTADDGDLALGIQRLVEGRILEGATLHERGSFVVTVDTDMFMSLHKLLDPAFEHKNELEVTHEVISRSLRSLANIMDKQTGRVVRRNLSHAPCVSGIRLTSASTLPSHVAVLSQSSYNNCPPLMLQPTLERFSADRMRHRKVMSTPSSFAPVGNDDTCFTLADVFRDVADMSLGDIKIMLSNIVSCTRSSQSAEKDSASSSVRTHVGRPRGGEVLVNVCDLITDYIVEYGAGHNTDVDTVCRFCGLLYLDEKTDKGTACCEQAAKLKQVADKWPLQRKVPFPQGFIKWDAITMAAILDDFQSHITDKMVGRDGRHDLRLGALGATHQQGHVIASKRRRVKKAKHKESGSKDKDEPFTEVDSIPSGESEHELRVTNLSPPSDPKDPNLERPSSDPVYTECRVSTDAAIKALVGRIEHNAISDGFNFLVDKSEVTTQVLVVGEDTPSSSVGGDLIGSRPSSAKRVKDEPSTLACETKQQVLHGNLSSDIVSDALREAVLEDSESKLPEVGDEASEGGIADETTVQRKMAKASSFEMATRRRTDSTEEGGVVRLVKSHNSAEGSDLCGGINTLGPVDRLAGSEAPDEAITRAESEADEAMRTTPAKNQAGSPPVFKTLPLISESEESLEPNTKGAQQSKRVKNSSSAEYDAEIQRNQKASKKGSMLHVMMTGTRRSKRGLRNKSKPRRTKAHDEKRQLEAARKRLDDVLKRVNLARAPVINTMIVQLQSNAVEEATSPTNDVDSDVEPKPGDVATESPDASRASPSDSQLAVPPREVGGGKTVSVSQVVKILHALAKFVLAKGTDKSYDRWLELRELLLDPGVRQRFTEDMWIALANMLFPELWGTTKHVTYQAIRAHPHFCWFRPRVADHLRFYANGGVFSKFCKDGSGQLFYPDGVLAIDFINKKRGGRYMVYSPATRHVVPSLCAESVLIAMFDLNGNGVIYDTDGSVRLHYTQREGVLLDSTHGMPIVWTWPLNYVADDPCDVLVNELYYMSQDPVVGVRTEASSNQDLPMFPDIYDSKLDLLAKMSGTNRVRSSSLVRRSNVSSIPTATSLRSSRPDTSDGPRGDVTGDENELETLLSSRRQTPLASRDSRPIRTPRTASNLILYDDDAEVNTNAPRSRERRSSADGASTMARSMVETTSLTDNKKWREIWLPVAPNEEVYESETDRVTKWKARHLRPDLCSHYPQIPVKINEYMSFRLGGQADVALTFSAEKLSLRIELGVVVNPAVKLRVDLYDAGSWPDTRIPQCNLERFPPTKSMAELGEDLEERRRRKQERDAKREALERRLGLGKWD